MARSRRSQVISLSTLTGPHGRVPGLPAGVCCKRQSQFLLLKRERIKKKIYGTREKARSDIFDYIGMFYNSKRRHGSGDKMPPTEYENRYYRRLESVWIICGDSEALLRSGFSSSELQTVKSNVESYGGTLEQAIHDLARRFRALTWIVTVCTLIFVMLVLFSTGIKIIAGGVAFLFGIGIMMFGQPPVLCYKSWRYWRANRS